MELERITDLALNIDEIDKQHSKWLEMYKQMELIVSHEDLTESRTQMDEILEDMYRYTYDHFNYEEEFLRKIEYPEIYEHKQTHREMEEIVYWKYRSSKDQHYISAWNILILLKEWIVEHILIEDKKYADYIFENNIDYKKYL